MRFAAAAFGLFLVLSDFSMGAVEEPKIVEKVTPLPIALNRDFEFRKTKLYFLSEKLPKQTQERRTASSVTGTLSGRTAPAQKTLTLQDVPITFERQYRLFGAVTLLLEYRQEKLHEHVQAQEISYRNLRGTHKTEFKVIGDDYFDDGRVIAWRCLLVENGRIVAENHSYMWE